jgi:ATP-dependent DNA helicase RecG
MGLIEKYGSGIQRIVGYFKDANLPMPDFRNISDGFMVTVFSDIPVIVTNNDPNNDPDNDPDNGPDNGPEKRLLQILDLIKKDHKVLLQELSEKIKVSKRTIRRDIEKLKTQNKLKRIGNEKTGHWQIIQDPDNLI